MARFRRRRAVGLLPLSVLARDGAKRQDVGGKVLGLLRAMDLGLHVPEAWVLPAGAFRDAVRNRLPPGQDPHALLRIIERPAGLERAARARDQLLDLRLDATVQEALRSLWEEVGDSAPWGLAVRSSASCEDDALVSMAGINESVLGVRGADAMAEAVRLVWASAVRENALRYLRMHRIKDVAIAVLIQRIVVARAAGVMFTSDPVAPAGARQKLRVASASFGLGCPVVAGTVHSDTIRFDETGNVVDQQTAVKVQKLVIGDSGIEKVAVAPEEASEPALSPTAVTALAEIAGTIEARGGGPHEVEFAVPRRGGVRVVQLRRATGTGFPPGGDATTVWSRAGLGEGLSGVLTPLTWSVFEALSERGFHKGFDLFAAKAPKGSRIVGRVHGRLYFNVSVFMKAASEVPGLDPTVLLELAGGEGLEALQRQIPTQRSRRKLARLPLTATRLLTAQGRLRDEVRRYDRDAEQYHRWLAEMDLGILPDDSLKTTLLEVRAFFDRTGMLALTCSAASLAAHLGLKTVLARSAPVAAERIAQAITSGVGDLESARLGVALSHVVAISRRDGEAATLLANGTVRALEDLPDGPARRALAHFLAAYGDTAVREAELSEPRWAEDPAPLLAIVAAGLNAGSLDPDALRTKARAQADRELAALEGRLPYLETVLVHALVSRMRNLTRLRERMRVWLTRATNMLRVVALDADRRLRRLDASVPEHAAFFCTFDELSAAVDRGRPDLASIVRLRRAELERDRGRPDPPVTFVGAPPAREVPQPARAVLRGVPGSSGVVTGRVRTIGPGSTGFARLEPGEVLLSRTTDVALSPLFLIAAGIVTEIGSPLSHAAILAREYGVPAVLGVHDATRVLRDGERIAVDGDRGVVERLEP